ncbi:MAG TPA: hypothetical protein VHH73_01760, partial [Verrucomicrobiae bacterium]|nr:hypothetical protein [Verrucomicrobiae bacterium]
MHPRSPSKLSRRCWLRSTGLGLLGFGLWPGVTRAAERRTPKFLLQWGKRGEGKGEFHSPVGIAINRHDEIFVTDLLNERVQVFRLDGKFVSMFPVPKQPGGIAVDH